MERTESPNKQPDYHRSLLETEFEIENEVETLTAKLLNEGQLGKRAPQICKELDTALSLFLQIASCQWGCRGGDHHEENLVRRLANYSFAALRLARFGLYDEALAIIRSAAELGNLIELFTVRRSALKEWLSLSERDRRNAFSPFAVRKEIESSGNRPIADKEVYGAFCDIGVHISPDSAHSSHQVEQTVFAGGAFSVMGFLLVLNELAIVLSACLKLVGHLIEASEEQIRLLTEAGERLESGATSYLRITNYRERLQNMTKRDSPESDKSP